MKRTKFFLLALVLAIAGVTQAQNIVVLLEEDFESLPLGPNVDEGLAGDAVWTDIPPAGWFNDASGVPGIEDPATDGVTEWAGWGFADKEWWTSTAGDQRRSEFDLGQGTVAIADPDEWDDTSHPDVPSTGTYDVYLSTRPIDLSTSKAGTVHLEFVSSWRPEFDDDYHQTGNLTVSYDGGEPIELFLWESDSSSPNFKDDNSTNETITVEIDNPAGATSMVLTWGLFNAGNDWWWAIDNIVVTAEFSAINAYHPSPLNGAVEVPVKTDLSWTPGQYVGGLSPQHRVILSDDLAAVEDGSAVVSTQDANSFDATGYLDFSTTYYWRIDEANRVSGWDEGSVWSFTTESFAYAIENVTATSNGVSEAGAGPENTVNGSGLNEDDQHSTSSRDMWLGVPAGADPIWIQYDLGQVYKLHEMIVWNYNVEFELLLGFGLKDVTVEYSADGADWTALGNVELAQATAKSDYAANTTIDFGGVPAQYVRLTVNSGWGMMGQYGLSEVRFFQIPAHAREPQPADGQAGVPIGGRLTWRAGREAETHQVYLSADQAAVTDGTAPVETVTTNSFAPTGLEFGMDYYWRVDEVNEADAISTWPGPTWTFVTQEYAVIDDFEAYDNDENRIYDTWLDGWVNETGSTVGYLEEPFAEQRIVYAGAQSMPLEYRNDIAPFYSEAERDLGGANLTGNGADTLFIHFRGSAAATEGQAGNDPASVYVAVEDNAGNVVTVVHPDPEATVLTEWQVWQIPFSDLGGVSLNNVSMIYIGVGDRDNPSADGAGTIYVDDVGFGRPYVGQ
ncbi:MAG: discoidin domain-containing protein [Phycisphaerales bacterium]|nr:MAG: discoidin domain-containing protein [Phycisphaerales bacterium]